MVFVPRPGGADLVPGEQPAISENASDLLRMKAVILDEPGCLPFRRFGIAAPASLSLICPRLPLVTRPESSSVPFSKCT